MGMDGGRGGLLVGAGRAGGVVGLWKRLGWVGGGRAGRVLGGRAFGARGLCVGCGGAGCRLGLGLGR